MLDFISTNWLPLGKEHWGTYVAQVVIGLIFVAIYFFLFRFLILKFDIPLPGRKKTEEEVKLFSKQDYKIKKAKIRIQNVLQLVMNTKTKLRITLDGLGGKENIKDVTNCTTRLRLTVYDENKVADTEYFTHQQMAHGLVKSGKSIQVVVGMTVPQVREAFEQMVEDQSSEDK